MAVSPAHHLTRAKEPKAKTRKAGAQSLNGARASGATARAKFLHSMIGQALKEEHLSGPALGPRPYG